MSTIPQIASLKKRLHELRLQKARYGISVDPHISIEANDIETVISQMELIDIHRRNIDILTRQASSFGQHAPSHIINQIASERVRIAGLIQVCTRLGQHVPSHPLDSDEQDELPPITPQQAAQPKSDLHTKLDQAIALLIEIRASL